MRTPEATVVDLLTSLMRFALGWTAWTFSEYVLHRWAMHGLRGRGLLSREHLRHHAQPQNLSWSSNVFTLTRIALVSIAILLASLLLPGALGFATGWVIGYVSYEVFHWRSHDFRPMRSILRYDLWLRRRHLHHHFVRPLSNFGVTVDLWDRVFRTHEPAHRVRLPLRAAPSWLVGPQGEVRIEYSAGYELDREQV